MKFFGVLENDSRDPLGYSERVLDITGSKITFYYVSGSLFDHLPVTSSKDFNLQPIRDLNSLANEHRSIYL